jgi:hypothetical protein
MQRSVNCSLKRARLCFENRGEHLEQLIEKHIDRKTVQLTFDVLIDTCLLHTSDKDDATCSSFQHAKLVHVNLPDGGVLFKMEDNCNSVRELYLNMLLKQYVR